MPFVVPMVVSQCQRNAIHGPHGGEPSQRHAIPAPGVDWCPAGTPFSLHYLPYCFRSLWLLPAAFLLTSHFRSQELLQTVLNHCKPLHTVTTMLSCCSFGSYMSPWLQQAIFAPMSHICTVMTPQCHSWSPRRCIESACSSEDENRTECTSSG